MSCRTDPRADLVVFLQVGTRCARLLPTTVITRETTVGAAQRKPWFCVHSVLARPTHIDVLPSPSLRGSCFTDQDLQDDPQLHAC